MPAEEVGRKSQFWKTCKTTFALPARSHDFALDGAALAVMMMDGVAGASSARGNLVMTRSRAARLAAALLAAVLLAALFWRSLTATLAGWIVDFFVAVVRLFLALAHFLF